MAHFDTPAFPEFAELWDVWVDFSSVGDDNTLRTPLGFANKALHEGDTITAGTFHGEHAQAKVIHVDELMATLQIDPTTQELSNPDLPITAHPLPSPPSSSVSAEAPAQSTVDYDND